MGFLVNALRRAGMRKGVVGGDSRWLSIWLLIGGFQLLRRIAKPKPAVERIELRPGETIVVTDLGRPEADL